MRFCWCNDSLRNNGIRRTPQSNLACHIIRIVTSFINELKKDVGEVRDPNEFDFMFYLSSLAENSAPSYSPDDTPGYSKFEFKDGKGSELVKGLLKRDREYLFSQSSRIKVCVFSLISDILS